MPQALPSWFAADHVFRGSEGWYIGSPTSFKVGPYPHQADAEARSRQITEQLKHCSDIGTMVRTVRAFLGTQNSPPETTPVTSTPAALVPPGGGAPPAADRVSTPGDRPVVGSIEIPPLREGESQGVWFRTSRYFAVDDAWFFATRENVDVGPYQSKEAAETDVARLLAILKVIESEAERRRAIYEFKSRSRRTLPR
jgi:hypothetical protein